jgi:hypothetical protein
MTGRIKVKGLEVSDAYQKALRTHEWHVSSNGSRVYCVSCKAEFAYFSVDGIKKIHKRSCSYVALARELGVELSVKEV